MALVILKDIFLTLLWYCNNTQCFDYVKWSSTSKLIKGKLRYLQKLLRYLTGIVTSTFNFGACGRAGWSVSPSLPNCAGLASIFHIFCLILKLFSIWSIAINIIHFISINISQTSWCHRITVAIFRLYIGTTVSHPLHCLWMCRWFLIWMN